MAVETTDAEFRLPSEFLVDDFFLEKNGGCGDDGAGAGGGGGGRCFFPTEFPYEWEYGSNMSSPEESMTGTESSDEEDYMAGLTRQMAHYFLQDEEKIPCYALSGGYAKAMAPVGSPQSTLWSSRESSNGPSLVSSPPSTLEQCEGDAWDLLYAAAGQVMRMKVNDECDLQQAARGLLGHPVRKPSPPLPKSAAAGYATAPPNQHQNQNQNHFRAQQFQQLKQEQMLKHQHGAGAWNHHSRPKGAAVSRVGIPPNNRAGRQQGPSPAAWPPFHQQPRSGMRAVFLGLSSKRESCGTGVFLPRRVDSPADFRKKPACATVLLPARVVQALNLDLEELAAQPRFSGGFVVDQGSMAARGNAMLLQRQSYHRPQPAPAIAHHRPEIRLPSEWTY